jgi:hypothetical protein
LSDRAAEAFRSLQAKARAEHGGNTQPLLVVYAVESFLRRLAVSDYAERMVWVVTDPASIRTEVMREGDEYQGVRCKLVAGLGRARIPFALDISFGDPGTSTMIELTSVIDQPDVSLRAYPLALNLAEKIVTAMQRRETSTRGRDFADLWVCSRRFDFEAAELLGHIREVAGHRQQAVMPLAEALANMPDRQQPYAAMGDLGVGTAAEIHEEDALAVVGHGGQDAQRAGRPG